MALSVPRNEGQKTARHHEPIPYVSRELPNIQLHYVPLLSSQFLELDLEGLSEEERSRAKGLATDDSRRRFISSRIALRRLAACYLGVDAHVISFALETFGKPRVVAPVPHHLHFSLSRSSDWALIAFSLYGPIGVDIEQIRSGLSPNASFVLSAQELKESETNGLRQEELVATWTRKEAFVKAIGVGVRLAFDAIELDKEVKGPRLWRATTASSTGWVVDVAAPRGYVATIATTGNPEQLIGR